MRKAIRNLPFLLLLIDAIWWVLSFNEINIMALWWIAEVTSHSLSFCFFMAFYGMLHRYCAYSMICIGALTTVNLLNIAHYFLDLQYVQLYAGIIIFTGLIFAGIKWMEQSTRKA